MSLIQGVLEGNKEEDEQITNPPNRVAGSSAKYQGWGGAAGSGR